MVIDRHEQEPRLSGLQRDLLQKLELEAAMIAAPEDAPLRTRYFDFLVQFASVRTGLSHALLPELGHPLAFRCGTLDVVALAAMFRDRALNFPLRATPRRILLLGAHVGYAAIDLARRFPRAELLAVEPVSSNLRVLAVNAGPYPRIRIMPAAAWHGPARVGPGAMLHGDWAPQMTDAPGGGGVYPADSVDGLLRAAGWNQVDMVMCDIGGAERTVFADPGARWLRGLDTLAVVAHDAIAPGAAAAVAACFDPSAWRHRVHGSHELYERLHPFHALARTPPRQMPLISSGPSLFPVALRDVQRTGWGFYLFDGESCQLHPNPPGGAPAQVIFPRTLDGHTNLSVTLQHAMSPAAAIRFSVLVLDEAGDEKLRETWQLSALEHRAVVMSLPSLVGRFRFVLQTEMAEGAPHYLNAWARWLSPTLS